MHTTSYAFVVRLAFCLLFFKYAKKAVKNKLDGCSRTDSTNCVDRFGSFLPQRWHNDQPSSALPQHLLGVFVFFSLSVCRCVTERVTSLLYVVFRTFGGFGVEDEVIHIDRLVAKEIA